MTTDKYTILEPYGRDLAPESHWLASFPADAEIWAAWKLTDGEEIRYAAPLIASGRAYLGWLLKHAAVSESEEMVAVGQFNEDGTARQVRLGDVASLTIEVRS